jgi:hypothetical protein
MAIDMNMTFLLTSQPGSLSMGIAPALHQSAAIILGVLVAVATYRLLLPSAPAPHCRKPVLPVMASDNRLNRAAATPMQTHRALRAALPGLLDFCDPLASVFAQAQAGLDQSALLLVQHACSHDADSRITAPTVTAGEALARACVVPSRCVAAPASTAAQDAL